jgi:predicted P-loop ATPase
MVDLEGLRRDRDQLWAEALYRYRAGEPWWLTDEGIIDEAIKEQASRYEAHPWRDHIQAWLDTRESVSVPEVLTDCLKKPMERWEQRDKNTVADCLKSLGWKRRRPGQRGKREWRYFPPKTEGVS